mmetsp:Transcript_43227/g.101683  ORF Transcript_43227/g.101683 Transcript_43227/m.101683 type:complete len:1159 (-) Transcript_43227:223-3699(-)
MECPSDPCSPGQGVPKKYVVANGKEWCLKQISPTKLKGETREVSPSLGGYRTPSTASGHCTDDSDAGSVDGTSCTTEQQPRSIKEISSYLLSSESASVSVYLELEKLFRGASEIFCSEASFALDATADKIQVSMEGPSARDAKDLVEWRLSVRLPCPVQPEKVSLKLRKGKVTVKAPKAVVEPFSAFSEAAEEARAVARQLDVELPDRAQATASGVASSADTSASSGETLTSDKALEGVLRKYGQRMRRALQDKAESVHRKSVDLKFRGKFEEEPTATEAGFPGELLTAGSKASNTSKGQQLLPLLEHSIAEDSDGEEVRLCCQCSLPLGTLAYAADNGEGAHVHAECLAQLLLRDVKAEDASRMAREAKRKAQRRREYGIGWSPDEIPSNAGAAAKLLGSDSTSVPKGLCCIGYDEAAHRIELRPTLEPATAVNLEYLSLALEVRRREGTEPTFSLEPVLDSDLGSRDCMLQVKRYGPEWLAGTSIGEIMFQADYHLKELSMGEHVQPVVGMRSCFDFSEAEAQDKEWRAREWFVVQDCEVFRTNDDVLLPYVRMGIEAREQVKDDVEGLIDMPVTRPDHPLVKYAEEFTHYFDLIAERKSVIFHLRELAKATVLAKFLVEMELKMDDMWFQLASEPKVPGSLEIPQLWNERLYSDITTKDGAIMYSSKGDGTTCTKGVYGGVTFGIEDFRFATHPQVQERAVVGVTNKPSLFVPRLGRGVASLRAVAPEASRAMAGVARQEQVIVPTLPAAGGRAAPPSEQVATAWPVAQAQRPRRIPRAPRPPRGPRISMSVPPLSAVAPISSIAQALAGVDLGLEQFNLSEPVKTACSGTGFSGDEGEQGLIYGEEFFAYLNDRKTAVFEAPEQTLLSDIFNPALSDRRSEGQKFTPPDTSIERVRNLRALVREESAIRQERMALFLSIAFEASDPGPLFPFTWKSLHCDVAPAPKRTLRERPEYLSKADVILDSLASATPTFDRVSEDGVRFRIYSLGTLEVRTTQLPEGSQEVQAVFSVTERPESEPNDRDSASQSTIDNSETVAKMVVLVEKSRAHGTQESASKLGKCHYYVVAETECNHTLVAELADGGVELQENPVNLDVRNSLAKVLNTCPLQGKQLTVADLRSYCRSQSERAAAKGASQSRRKKFAWGALGLAQESS